MCSGVTSALKENLNMWWPSVHLVSGLAGAWAGNNTLGLEQNHAAQSGSIFCLFVL